MMAEGLTQALGEEGADPGVTPGPCHLLASLLADSDGPLHPRGGGGEQLWPGRPLTSQEEGEMWLPGHRPSKLLSRVWERVWSFPVISRVEERVLTPQGPTWWSGLGSTQVSFTGGSLRAGVINQQYLDPRTAPNSVPSPSWPCPLGLREMSAKFRHCVGNQ